VEKKREKRTTTTKATPEKRSYPEELAAWLQHHNPSRRDAGRLAFLAVQSDVQAALLAGFSTKAIWRHMRETGRTPLRYETFLRYVHRALPAQPASPTPSPRQPPPQGFHFNAIPRKEDLL
jgi:hypothetical protein